MAIVASIEDQTGNRLESSVYGVTRSDGSRGYVYELSVDNSESNVTIYLEPETLVRFLMDGGLVGCMVDVLEKEDWATANPEMKVKP